MADHTDPLREALQNAADVLEEAQSYTGCELWSPSLTAECARAVRIARAALAAPSAPAEQTAAQAVEPWRCAGYPESEAEATAQQALALNDQRLYGVGVTVNGWRVPAPLVSVYGLAAQPAKVEPLCYMSPKQVSHIKDADDEAGGYIPMRKTPAGNFTLPLYAAPPAQPAKVGPVELRKMIENYANAKADLAMHPTHTSALEYFKLISSILADALAPAAPAAPPAQAVAQPEKPSRADLIAALEFYAHREHMVLSEQDAWDTVSGEPQNWWCDEAGTATIEDGTIAKITLAGELTAEQIKEIEDGDEVGTLAGRG